MLDWRKVQRDFGRFRKKGRRLFGILGDENGVINVPDRPGYQYARVERGSGRVTIACKGNARPRLNTAVIIEQDAITGEFEIAGLDVATTQAAGDDPATALFTTEPHAPSHEWRPDADDMLLWLNPLQMYFLRVQPGEMPGHVIVQGGPYFVGGNLRWKRAQSDLDLTGYYAGSGSVWVMVCIDGAGNFTIVQKSGGGNASDIEDLGPIPVGHIALGAVRLTVGAPFDFFSDFIPLWQITQFDASVLYNGTVTIDGTKIVLDLLNYPDLWGKWATLGEHTLAGKNILALRTQWDSDWGMFGVMDEGANRKDTVVVIGDDGSGVSEYIQDRFVVYGYGIFVADGDHELRPLLTITMDGAIAPYADGGTFDGVDVSAHAADTAAHHIRYADSDAVAAMGEKGNANPLNHDRYTGSEAVLAVLAVIHNSDPQNPPADADEMLLLDSAAGFYQKKLTWAIVKAALQTYFDTLYNLYVHPNHSGDVTSVGDGATTIANKQPLTATLPVTLSNSPTVIAGAAPVIAINAATTEAAGVSELATDAEVAAATAGVIPTVPQLPLYRQTTTNALQADTGGDARGANAMDLQISRTTASQVASGNYSAIPGGYGNVTSGDYSHAMGRQNAVSGAYASAEGYLAAASLYGEHAHAAGVFAAQGGAQYRRFVLRRSVTAHADATWYQLFLDGSSALLSIPSNALWNFTVKIVGLTNGAAQRWSYDVSGTVVNDGGTVTLLESAVTSRYESDSAYAAQVVGNNPNDSLDIEVRRNGGSAYTIRWVAVVEVVQVIY